MPAPQHATHYTDVLNRMTGHEHLRRSVCSGVGMNFASNFKKTIEIDIGGALYPGSLTRQEAVVAAAFGRGSDALFDAGSTVDAVDAMRADPLNWAYVWHCVTDSERWDAINDFNSEVTSLMLEMVRRQGKIDPFLVLKSKLMGVYVANQIERSDWAKLCMNHVNDRPFTINQDFILKAFGPHVFETIGLMVAADTAELDISLKRKMH